MSMQHLTSNVPVCVMYMLTCTCLHLSNMCAVRVHRMLSLVACVCVCVRAYVHVCACPGCAVLLCLVCLFDLACLLLSFFLLISHLKTCVCVCVCVRVCVWHMYMYTGIVSYFLFLLKGNTYMKTSLDLQFRHAHCL